MLDVDVLRTTGRAPRAVTGEVVRALDRADLALLGEEKGSVASPLKRISDRHHTLARYLAQGTAPGEAALICNYDPSRVSILLNDPTFKELVEFYRADVDRTYRGLHEKLFGLAMDAAEELATRLEEPEQAKELSVTALIEVVKMGADRTGHGPQATNTNLNVNVDLATRLQAARERVAQRRIIEGGKP